MARFRAATPGARLAFPPLDRWHALAATALALLVLPFVPVVLTTISGVLALPAAGPGTDELARAAGGTLITALAATLVGAMFGIPVAEAIAHSRGALGALLRVGALLPLAVPPLSYGLGVRRLVEVAGLAPVLLDDASGALALLPVVLAHSCVTVAIVVAAWEYARLPRGHAERAAREDAALTLGASTLARVRHADPAGAATGLRIGLSLALLHSLVSAAAPLAFPSASAYVLPALVLGAESSGVAAMYAALPLAFTLPLLMLARRGTAREATLLAEGGPARWRWSELAGSWSGVGAMGVAGALALAIVVGYAVLPLIAVVLTGAGPLAIAAVIVNQPAADIGAALVISAGLALAACVGALLPPLLVTPAASAFPLGQRLSWLMLALTPVALVVSLRALGIDGLAGAVVVHALLGAGAALPLLVGYEARTSKGAHDAARVLGATPTQAFTWGDPARSLRLAGSVAAVCILVSLGDVAVGSGTSESARPVGATALSFLQDPEAERGAFAFGGALALVGVGGLLVVEAAHALPATMWARR